jgi:hypothetical protein
VIRFCLLSCFLLPALALAQIQKPPAGAQINGSHPLATGLVSMVPLNEGSGSTFYDAVSQLHYPALTLTGTPANAQPPAWITPPVTADYPWIGPGISNNGATAKAIQCTLQTQFVNGATTGYSYAVLVQPLDTTTFGRIMDGTGAAVVTFYLNIPGRLDLVSTTWRNASNGPINPTDAFVANKWILVVCTIQQGLGIMYVNGVEVARDTTVNLAQSMANQTGQLVYNCTGNGSMMCNANFSSWWIWNNRVLTAQDVANLYANPWAMFAPVAPAVTAAPANQKVTGTTATFTAAASGYPAPTIQWQVSTTGAAGSFNNIDSVANPSAATGTLTLTNVTPAQNGYAYRATFTNTGGSATTAPATLTVYSVPVLNLPANITVPAANKGGAAVNFNGTATDTVDGALTPTFSPTSGSTFPLGTTRVSASATDSGGLTATGSFTVTVQRSYAWFQDQYALSDGDPTADPNHTGVSNLEAYALALNPAIPDRSQWPSEALVGGHLQISYPQWTDAADVTYVVEVSGDLQTWNSGNGYIQQISTTPIDALREEIVVSDLTPTTSAARRFMRLRLTLTH